MMEPIQAHGNLSFLILSGFNEFKHFHGMFSHGFIFILSHFFPRGKILCIPTRLAGATGMMS
jgi:hypothetical protein